MNLLAPAIPLWYLLLALAVSAYQGCRGFVFQLHGIALAQVAQTGPGFVFGARNRVQGWLLRAAADAILYGVTTFAGFIALLLDERLSLYVDSVTAKLTGPEASMLIFLTLLGLLGVTGQLTCYSQGKFPKP